MKYYVGIKKNVVNWHEMAQKLDCNKYSVNIK